VSNEVLLLYPKTYYVQWLNGMLVQGLWNLIFLFANISLFILLPFAYLFIESEGFSGHKKVRYHLRSSKNLSKSSRLFHFMITCPIQNLVLLSGNLGQILRDDSHFDTDWFYCVGNCLFPRSSSESREKWIEWILHYSQLLQSITFHLLLHFLLWCSSLAWYVRKANLNTNLII